MSGFKTSSDKAQPGQPITAGATNALAQSAFDNTQLLQARIDEAGTGCAVICRLTNVAEDIGVGDVVYLDTQALAIKKAVVSVTLNPNTLTFMADESSQVVGLVRKKTSPTTADITMFGADYIDISGVIDTPLAPGVYYLSATNPGTMTLNPPAVPIPVLKADGFGRVFIDPQWQNIVYDHIHYKFDLTAAPAGTHVPPTPAFDATHEIIGADSDLPGWLPADDPIFAGKAPEGAFFGYNITKDPSLNGFWPPIPVDSASLVWYRGTVSAVSIHDIGDPSSSTFSQIRPSSQGMEVSMNGDNSLVTIDDNGIWWNSNCFNEVPWNALELYEVDSASASSSASATCPRDEDAKLTLYFIKPAASSTKTVVTSLRSIDPRLLVQCYPDGTPDTLGDLQLDLDLDFATGQTNVAGFSVFKDYDEETNEFNFGPVVEKIVAGANISISNVAPAPTGQGVVTINADVDPAGRELPVTLVRLDGASEGFILDIPVVVLEVGYLNSYRGKIHIPAQGLPASPNVKFRFRLSGSIAGTLTDLDLVYRRIPAAGTPTALPSADTPLSITTSSVILGAANEYQDVESATFTVAAGDLVVFELSRDPTGDSYTGDIYVVQQVGIIGGA